MDSRCDHHTSNLQLLKLHIYCCHFRRKLPENATLSSKDPEREDDTTIKDDPIDVVEDMDDFPQDPLEVVQPDEPPEEEQQQQQINVDDSPQKSSTPSTPRRDSRLRKNPPRSSTFGHHDYASVNNGKNLGKILSSTPTTSRKSRVSLTPSSSSQVDHHQQLLQRYSDQNEWESTQDFGYDGDFEISDNGIFATATPTTSTKISTPGTPKVTYSKRSNKLDESQSRVSTSSSHLSQSIKQEVSQDFSHGFPCDEPGCGKSFPSLRKLRHHKVVHSDDFPFVCEFQGCNKKFKRKFGIDLHSTTHFDLDPGMYSKTSNNSSLPFFGRRMQYSMCKPCGQKFKTVHEYQYHMLKHGKEPFKCPVKGCGQTFSIWKSFQKHRASHYFNYYCKMDSRCDHHTSNLQLLKLHIYCCHFRRNLPENATLASKDAEQEDEDIPIKDEQMSVEDEETESMMQGTEDQEEGAEEEEEGEEEEIKVEEENVEESQTFEPTPPSPTPPPPPPPPPIELEEKPVQADEVMQPSVMTPRRDSRLRKNPPRSSTFGHQDYASVNNGKSFARAIASTPPSSRKARASITSGSSQSTPSEKKTKLPIKVLPKRSSQRLPMSLIAAEDGSSEDDDIPCSESGDSFQNDRDEEDQMCQDTSGRAQFRCHLCDYKFSVRFQLTKHLSTHLELTSEMYSATADGKVIQLSERRRREFYCDKCNVKFEQMPELDNHMRRHGQRPYVCNFCQVPSTFRLAKQYLSHLYEHRFNYKCTMEAGCDFTINRKDALKLHIFRMHLNQQLPSYIENYAMVECNE